MKKLFRIRNIVIILSVFILILVGILLMKKIFLSENRDIIIGRVTKGELVQRVTISGEVVSNRTTFVNASYNGYIKKIYVKIGDHVKEGKPLVSISQTLNFSDQVFPILAPFDATVVHIQKMEGEYVYGNSGYNDGYILRMDDVSRVFVNAKVPEIDIVKIKHGQEVVIKATAIQDHKYKGVITDISLASFKSDWRDASGANFPIKIEVTNKDENIKPGMTVTVDVVTNKVSDTLLLGHEYIYQKDDNYFVYMENGQKRDIQVGISNETFRQILGGLKEGDKIRQYDFTALLEDKK